MVNQGTRLPKAVPPPIIAEPPPDVLNRRQKGSQDDNISITKAMSRANEIYWIYSY